MGVNLPGSVNERKVGCLALVFGLVIGIIVGSWLLGTTGFLGWIDELHEILYFFGLLFLSVPIVALLGTTAAAIYAGLASKREQNGTNTKDTVVDPLGVIDAISSAPRWIVVALLGLALLFLGALL